MEDVNPLSLQTQQGLQTVVLRTVPYGLYLLHWIPDTAGGDETFANHALPFHALIGAGQQGGGLQPGVVSRLRLKPYAVS